MSATTFDLDAELAALREDTRLVHRATGIAQLAARRRAERIVRLRSAGVPYRALADAIGVTIPAIQRIIERSGLEVTPATCAPTPPAPLAQPSVPGVVGMAGGAMGAGVTVGGAR